MNRFFRVFLTSILLSFSLSSVVSAAIENFGGWTEVDPNSRIVVTSNRVTWTNLTRNEDAYVYKDKGIDYFSGNFEIQFNFKTTAATEIGTTIVGIGSLTNAIDDLKGIDDANGDYISLVLHDKFVNYDFDLVECSAGTTYSSGVYGGALNTNYYITIKRNEAIGAYGTIYCYVYSDSSRTNLLSTLSLALHDSRKDFRYLYAVDTMNTSEATRTHSGYIENLNIVSVTASAPSVTTIAATNVDYDPWFEYFNATISGNITDDGGEPCTVGFLYRVQSVGEWSSAILSGYYGQDSEPFDIQLSNLVPETIYEYKAYVSNSANTTYGSTLTFTTSFYTGLPSVTTLGYPLILGSDNATLYGYIEADGSSNCTGWIQYRHQGDSDWIVSSNTTDLVSGDDFNANVGSLVESWVYEFRAAAQNDSGTNYGGIAEFQILPSLTTPEVDTLSATLVTSDTAWINGLLVNDGGTDCWLYFQWKVAGATTWLETNKTINSSNTTFLRQLTGLTPLQNYEYRAVASNYNVYSGDGFVAYGTIMSLTPFAAIGTPVIITGDAVYVDDVSMAVTGSVQYDGGAVVAIWFQYRLYGETTWLETDKAYGVTTGYEVQSLLYPLEYGRIYQYRALGENTYGLSYGSIRQSTVVSPEDIIPPDDGIPVISDFAQIIDDIKAQFHLYGVMGTWAFLGLILLVIALVFGVAIVATPDAIIKRMVSVAWGLISIAVLGAFLFTGQLGIWPILIIVGGVVVLIFIIGSSVLSGSSNNG